jgi:hypothetical protein
LDSQKFIHSVYFWMRRDLDEAQLAAFREGLNTLPKIETVHQGYVGIPAATDRPIIDRTYDYALVLVFKNQRQHDLYQEHPVHDSFRQKFSSYWLRVQIYDMI